MDTREWTVVAVVAALFIVPQVLALRNRRKRAQAARAETSRWASAPGRITASELRQSGGELQSAVWYTFEVGGKRYSSNVLDVGDEVLRENRRSAWLFTRFTPGTAIRSFPEGSAVTVYYDPEDPGRSCLWRE